MTTQRIRQFLAALLGVASLAGCVGNTRETSADGPPRIAMHTSSGDIVIELDPARAPVTVANFLHHIRAGHYNGTIIHRVVPGFVIQGGGWTAELVERAKVDAARGQPDTPIVNEWSTSGLKNLRGTIAMARDADPDSATREFFINLADNARLDIPRETAGGAGYAVFGRVVEGMEVVDAMAQVPTRPRPETGVTDVSMNNVPIEPIVVRKVRIERE